MFERLVNLLCSHRAGPQKTLPPSMREVRFSDDGKAQWAGMGDHRLISADGRHQLEVEYVSEPPHGDSVHRVIVDGRVLPGYAWGCMFAISPCSRYAAFSWMATMYERRTIVVDMSDAKYAVLPEYIYDFVFRWPKLNGINGEREKSYSFDGSESWHPY